MSNVSNDTIRLSWEKGHGVEIYSVSKGKWFPGKILRIFNDAEGEWLEVKYGTSTTKEVRRWSPNIRSIQRSTPRLKMGKFLSLTHVYYRKVDMTLSNGQHLPEEVVKLLCAYYYGNTKRNQCNKSRSAKSISVVPPGLKPLNGVLLHKKAQRHRFRYPATGSVQTRSLLDIHEAEHWMFDTNIGMKWTLQHEEIMDTMSELLFELTKMFKTPSILNMTRILHFQLDDLKKRMRDKKEILVLGFIRRIQRLLMEHIIPLEVKSLCLAFYGLNSDFKDDAND